MHKKKEKEWINIYKKNNWELFNVHSGGALGGTIIKWSNKKLQEVANKYDNRLDFSKYDHLAYVAAVRKKLLNKLFENKKNNGFQNKKKRRILDYRKNTGRSE